MVIGPRKKQVEMSLFNLHVKFYYSVYENPVSKRKFRTLQNDLQSI